ncbi:MAG TPA: hypothetical protein VH044_15680 [Polyangiaceae bacterium]|nr:hypothetical protein [Polyangiaceae bacterium]
MNAGAILRATLLLAAALSLAAAPSACGGLQRAAARDPQKCEQNPDCAAHRGAYMDCSRQCADNPECVDRCIEMTTDQPKH